MHALKIVAEVLGGLLALVVLVAVIMGALIVHDSENGGNPFQ